MEEKKKGGLNGIEKSLGNILKAYVYGECSKNFKNFLVRNSIICLEFRTLTESFNQAFKDARKQQININILLSLLVLHLINLIILKKEEKI